jgi:hypothetical protein
MVPGYRERGADAKSARPARERQRARNGRDAHLADATATG